MRERIERVVLGLVSYLAYLRRSIIPVRYQIEGSVADGKYTSVHGDFRVVIPKLMKPGALARDEKVGSTLTQVIFTDDLGRFYRLISLNNESKEFSFDRIMSKYPNARDTQELNTSRGREIRFIDIEKAGAEIAMYTAQGMKGDKTEWEETKLDLVTANAVFQANNRIYHVIAGVTVFSQQAVERDTKEAKERLEEFIGGLEIVPEAKEET